MVILDDEDPHVVTVASATAGGTDAERLRAGNGNRCA
jgi:hypothetical protein